MESKIALLQKMLKLSLKTKKNEQVNVEVQTMISNLMLKL